MELIQQSRKKQKSRSTGREPNKLICSKTQKLDIARTFEDDSRCYGGAENGKII